MTFGAPSVTVPVLSRITVFTCPVCSSAAAVLKRMPFLAPTPLPTMIATGVASPARRGSCHHTEMPLARAKPALSPKNSQTATVSAAMAMTTGTNTPETLSASFAMGALVGGGVIYGLNDLRKGCILRAGGGFTKEIAVLIDRPGEDPVSGCLSTGMLSPVSAASFTAPPPSRTVPVRPGCSLPGERQSSRPSSAVPPGR